MNGVTNAGGEYFSSKYDYHERSVRDVEMLRLIGQYLCDKGLNGAYSQLSKESGISLEHIDATELRHATLEGRWNDAEAAVDRLVPLIGDPSSAEEVRFLLLEQRFLEHLESNEVMPAVTLLRNRITPMQRNTERVHTLASCLMCRTNSELRAQAGGWSGKDHGSRLQLIDRIQAFVPAQTMLPPRRLEELIEDSISAQLSSCIFHNPSFGSQMNQNGISLLQRHSCGMHDFPAFCIQTMHQRDGELWLCQFSPDGMYLAVAGKDANVDLLRVDLARHSLSRFRVLTTQTYVSCICWSPDSKKLAACCGEEQSCVCVFDVVTGQQLCCQKVNDEDTYSSATFFADSRKLAFGGLKGVFYVMDTEDNGRILTNVEGYRVQSMAAILSPGSRIVPQSNLDEIKTPGCITELIAPTLPEQVPEGAVGVEATDPGSENLPPTTDISPNGKFDQLLVADSLHRIRLFRFGPIGQDEVAPQPPSSDAVIGSAVQSPDVGSTTVSNVPSPGTAAVAAATVAAALTVARLSRQQQQQQRLLQSTAVSTGGQTWTQQSYFPSPHGVTSTQSNPTPYSPVAGSTVPPGILLDMPILPVSLTRHGSTQATQTSPQSGLRPALHPHLGVTPYTVVSSSGSNVTGSSSGSSLTILFGPSLGRPSSASASITTSSEVPALTAAAASLTGSHSRSFAGLVHSLSSMVAAGSSVGEAGGRSLTAAIDTSMGLTPTTAVGTTTDSSAPGLAFGGSSLVTATTGFTPQMGPSSNYGLIDHRTLFKETHGVQSITMSRSGQRALITIHKMGLHLWDVESCAIIQRFIGYKQDTFRLTSTFGGIDEQFVATGSENGRIHVWRANGGNHPIYTAWSPSVSPTGDHDAVTCVHWNPVLPTMLACVNDSGEVKVWGPQRYTVGTSQPMDDSS